MQEETIHIGSESMKFRSAKLIILDTRTLLSAIKSTIRCVFQYTSDEHAYVHAYVAMANLISMYILHLD